MTPTISNVDRCQSRTSLWSDQVFKLSGIDNDQDHRYRTDTNQRRQDMVAVWAYLLMTFFDSPPNQQPVGASPLEVILPTAQLATITTETHTNSCDPAQGPLYAS